MILRSKNSKKNVENQRKRLTRSKERKNSWIKKMIFITKPLPYSLLLKKLLKKKKSIAINLLKNKIHKLDNSIKKVFQCAGKRQSSQIRS